MKIFPVFQSRHYVPESIDTRQNMNHDVFNDTDSVSINASMRTSSSQETKLRLLSLQNKKKTLPGENIQWKEISLNKEQAGVLKIDAMKSCNITYAPFLDEIDKKTPTPPYLEEKWAICMYTGYGYDHIPSVLRYGKVNENVIKYTPNAAKATIDSVLSLCRLIASGLNKLQEVKGDVYRGTGVIPDEFLREYIPGNVVTEHGFLSGSKVKDLVFTNDSLGVTRFTIKSKHARDASKFNGDFQEVIFLPETRFLITSREIKDSILYIEMEEVD